MNAKITAIVLIKKNAPEQKGISGCIYQKVFWKSARNPIKIS